jgi:Ca-activated chloride channel family protein
MNAEILQEFHFLRPEWFYALIPAIILFALLRYRQSSNSRWEKAIDPALLPFLLDNATGTVSKNPFSLLLLVWILAILALAGPVWEKTAQPVHEREDALIVLFDLTRSMYATDVKPNRLVRAKRKLIDLLKKRDEGITGLVVFAGDAHAVTPLTDDNNTIMAMIPALTPSIMPAPGSQLAPALRRAMLLFQDAGVASGRILIITDEIRDVAEAQRVARDYRYSYPVSVLAVGTPEGAPIPLSSSPARTNPDRNRPSTTASVQRGYLKDRNGNLVIPKVDSGKLQDFANLAGGRFSSMTLADEDLDYLLADEPLLENEIYRELERDFDVWFEEGPWLLLLLLPLAALSFRRGWIWCFALALVLPPESAQAGLWDDLWQTRDQQAMSALNEGKDAEAAELFESPDWKGSAHYKSENYNEAGNQFASIGSGAGNYNLGNALAKQGKYEEAIEAYSQSLAVNADNEDAIFNKKLLEELLSQQEQQQSEDGEQDESQDQSDQQQSQNEQSENEDEQESSESQNDEQQNADTEEQEPQDQTEDGEDEQTENQQMAEEDAKLDAEEQQALQQWLRRVPDDPGGLLRRKFEQQYEDRLRKGTISRNDPNADW